MKQHITKEQLDELRPKFQGILAAELDLEIRAEEDFMELPTIGQMIEFLGDDLNEIRNNKFEYLIIVDDFKICDGEDSLCDALWEAVKYKLNEKLN